jgi:hypothetical protein
MKASSAAPTAVISPVPREPPLRLVEPEQPRTPTRRFGLVAWVATVAAVAMLVSGLGIYLWQHGQVTDLRADNTALQAQLRTTEGQLTTVQQKLTDVNARLTFSRRQVADLRAESSALREQALGLEQRLATVTARRDALADLLSTVKADKQALARELVDVTAERDSLAAQLADTKAQLASTEADLQAANERLLVLAGPALADGRYTGWVFAAANSDPPRLAFRVASTVESTEVAHAGWRVLEVAPGTTAQFITWRNLGPRTVDYQWFAHVINSSDPLDASMRGDTQYWIDVNDGHVTALGEQG